MVENKLGDSDEPERKIRMYNFMWSYPFRILAIVDLVLLFLYMMRLHQLPIAQKQQNETSENHVLPAAIFKIEKTEEVIIYSSSRYCNDLIRRYTNVENPKIWVLALYMKLCMYLDAPHTDSLGGSMDITYLSKSLLKERSFETVNSQASTPEWLLDNNFTTPNFFLGGSTIAIPGEPDGIAYLFSKLKGIGEHHNMFQDLFHNNTYLGGKLPISKSFAHSLKRINPLIQRITNPYSPFLGSLFDNNDILLTEGSMFSPNVFSAKLLSEIWDQGIEHNFTNFRDTAIVRNFLYEKVYQQIMLCNSTEIKEKELHKDLPTDILRKSVTKIKIRNHEYLMTNENIGADITNFINEFNGKELDNCNDDLCADYHHKFYNAFGKLIFSYYSRSKNIPVEASESSKGKQKSTMFEPPVNPNRHESSFIFIKVKDEMITMMSTLGSPLGSLEESPSGLILNNLLAFERFNGKQLLNIQNAPSIVYKLEKDEITPDFVFLGSGGFLSKSYDIIKFLQILTLNFMHNVPKRIATKYPIYAPIDNMKILRTHHFGIKKQSYVVEKMDVHGYVSIIEFNKNNSKLSKKFC